jgi:pantoate--beta-alanine ligase
VSESIRNNDLTVVSIFVNPAQFAPHEDLTSYPRDLQRDLELLAKQRADLVFTPTVEQMYPSGISQNVSDQKGTFVEVKGFSHQMEGASRPTFFRGVATVVTKLFNVIQVSSRFTSCTSSSAIKPTSNFCTLFHFYQFL